MGMAWFLGVDGGQTSTIAAVGDEVGRVVGKGVAGPCNHVSGPGGRERFLRALGESVRAALAQARLDPKHLRFTAACLGFSGGPDDKADLVREFLHAEVLKVTHDAEVALSGAMAGEPGVIVIAGTGSIAYGRAADGRTARAGGWGYLFGDEGGAFDLTRQALRAALRAEEGWGPPTGLRDRLLELTGARTANELLHRFYTTEFSRDQIAALSVIVDELARKGDRVAMEIIERAGQQLAELGLAVRQQLFARDELTRISGVGGVFHCALLREHFIRCVCAAPNTSYVEPQFEPALGALIEAYRLVGLRVLPRIEEPSVTGSAEGML